MSVTIPTAHGQLEGHLATPAGSGPWPGVVVLHEVFGLTDDIRSITDRIAAEGYLAVAPNLFSWAGTPRCLVSTFRDLLRGHGPAHDRVDGVRDWLAAQEHCNGRVGVVGFCMGGGFALLAAPRGYAVAGVNYGLVPKDAERVLAGACPVVASYGAKDRGLRSHPARLENALTALGVDHDVHVYPGVSHGFLNQHHGWLTAFDKITGYHYGREQAEDAWRRTFAFFDRHLRAAEGPGGK